VAPEIPRKFFVEIPYLQIRHILKSAFIYSALFSQYDFGPLHPFKTARAKIVYELCHRYSLFDRPWIEIAKPEPLCFEKLALFHNSDYLNLLKAASSNSFAFEMLGCGLGTEENPVFEGLYDLIALSAGATYLGADLLVNQGFSVAFNVFGGFHHAGSSHAEGFCYINDVGIAISRLLKEGLKVAYIDLDAHHGNGIQDAFYTDPRVLKISLHESGKTLYPWSGCETEIGKGEGKGYNVNLPLPQGTDDETYLSAFTQVVPPLIKAFAPDITLGVFGADTHRSDPLTHLNMSNYALCEAVKIIRELSPRLLALGGGGYNLYTSARTWSLLWATMNEIEPDDTVLGAVGGMMYGPEAESGSLAQDAPTSTTGGAKEKIQEEVEEKVEYIKKTVFPLLGA
jgi:acetoin utilization protein AcuC